MGWVAIPTDLELSFSIPRGFTVTLRESPVSEKTISLSGNAEVECQAVDVTQLGWTLTPDTAVSIERDWMIEFYYTENCSEDPLLVQFAESSSVEYSQLVDEGWDDSISSAVVPQDLIVSASSDASWT